MTQPTGPQHIQWQPSYPSRTPPSVWGRSHWMMLMHVEVRCVDHRGALSPEWLNINPDTHHPQYSEKRAVAGGAAGYSPTVIKAATHPAEDGAYALRALPGHDEYDCLDDLAAAGLVVGYWPTGQADGTWVGAYGVVYDGDAVFTAAGLSDSDAANILSLHARWEMTELGWQEAHRLRRFYAAQNDPQNYVPQTH